LKKNSCDESGVKSPVILKTHRFLHTRYECTRSNENPYRNHYEVEFQVLSAHANQEGWISKLKITTLGPKGTYSEQASLLFAKRLGVKPEKVSLEFTTTNYSLRLVQNRRADYAVVPVENMIDGLIGSTFDALIEYQDFVKVCDEVHLPFSHVLAAHPQGAWDRIESIYSHPTALNQCQNHLAELYPKANLIAVVSTAEAAKIVLQDGEHKAAAICSPAIAGELKLQVFNGDIQDYSLNETRFLVCALTDNAPTGNDRTLLAVRYGANHPGQLYQTTKFFADAGIDLTCIHSRPYKVKPQEYVLIFELVGHKSNPQIEAALKNIELQVRGSDGWKKILGSFPKREREDLDANI
jgi:prephenate dehydratase